MTLGTLLLLILILYLVLIAYGVVGARRKFAGGTLLVVEALLILFVPVILTGALLAMGEGALVRQWARLFIAMPLLGFSTAVLADRIARRTAQ